MLHRSLGRTLATVAFLCAPLFGGDYDHVFNVVKETWPERGVCVALCDKDANQMTLIELADTAKDHNISLVIIDVKDEKSYRQGIANATARLGKDAGFMLLLEDDALLGLKGHLTRRMIYSATTKGAPVAGLTPAALELGAHVAAGADLKGPVHVNKKAIKEIKVDVPAGGIDPNEKVK